MNILNPHSKKEPSPDKGVLLIAEPYMKSPGFTKSVIILCEHGHYGSLGFILNSPSMNSIDMLLPELELKELFIHDGGPVATNTIQIMHRLPEHLGGVEVLPGIFWGGTYDELQHLTHRHKDLVCSQNLRVFRGYSGWDKGQLNDELQRHSWITAPGHEALIFSNNSSTLWEEALTTLGQDYALLTRLPRNPILN